MECGKCIPIKQGLGKEIKQIVADLPAIKKFQGKLKKAQQFYYGQ